jgi:hypothetical protein
MRRNELDEYLLMAVFKSSCAKDLIAISRKPLPNPSSAYEVFVVEAVGQGIGSAMLWRCSSFMFHGKYV